MQNTTYNIQNTKRNIGHTKLKLPSMHTKKTNAINTNKLSYKSAARGGLARGLRDNGCGKAASGLTT